MDEIINNTQYSELVNAVQAIKGAILQSQQRALGVINQEQLALYYGIGRYVSVIKIGVKGLLKLSASNYAKSYQG